MFELRVVLLEMSGARKVELALLVLGATLICGTLALLAMPACLVLGRLFVRAAEFVLRCLARPDRDVRLVIPLPVMLMSFLGIAALFGLSISHVALLLALHG